MLVLWSVVFAITLFLLCCALCVGIVMLVESWFER